MGNLTRIGMDTSKSVFVLHGVDGAEQPVLRNISFTANPGETTPAAGIQLASPGAAAR